jgi:hypothetical protein
LADNCVSASDERAKLFFTSLKTLLTRLYTTKLFCQLFRRIRQEYLLTKQIQRQLHFSSSNKSEVFHLGSTSDYHEKAIIYMNKKGAYEEVKNRRCPLVDNLSMVIELLDKLLKSKAVSQKQYSTMMPKKDKVELGHLYFLDRLLRPIFDRAAEHTTFVNGIDLVRQLKNY